MSVIGTQPLKCCDMLLIKVVYAFAWRLDVLHNEAGIQANTVLEYVAAYQLPKKIAAKTTACKHPFDGRLPGSGELKCSASEGLTLYPILRALLQEMLPTPTGHLDVCVTRACEFECVFESHFLQAKTTNSPKIEHRLIFLGGGAVCSVYG